LPTKELWFWIITCKGFLSINRKTDKSTQNQRKSQAKLL